MADKKPIGDIQEALRRPTYEQSVLGRARLIYAILHLSAPDRLEAMIFTRELRRELEAEQIERFFERFGLDIDYGAKDLKQGLSHLVKFAWWRLFPYGCWIEKMVLSYSLIAITAR